ncbi:MAG: 8-oxoguanine DNA glycosylase [Methanoregulaceae archaeon]|nr:8-oxoguanine DNA glycosylase [Methanoregulaceae archaeon]
MPRITLPENSPFSLDRTLGCGQVFRWEKTGEWWTGVVEKEVIRIRQKRRSLSFEGSSEERIRDYFSLDTDLGFILDSIDRDPVIHGTIDECSGLRLVNQPPWECLASYICATFSNIPGIRKKIALLSAIFGEPIPGGPGPGFYSFPSAATLADSAPCNLSRCSLGYRAPYLFATAREIASDPGWVERIGTLDYEMARRDLMKFRGVGPKVADCVLLFAFRKYEAFPVDVWITRIMQRHYGAGEKEGYERISRMGREYFGSYAGYAQEYLYGDRKRLLS